MRIDRILFLAAGFGTRMGEVGKHLPKPLWPLFGSTLIDILIKYFSELNPKEIFINIHHLADQMVSHFNGRDINLLHEKELLGVGGAIYNLANLNGYKGSLLVVNTDQIAIGVVDLIKRIEVEEDIVLISQEVKQESKLNSIDIEDNLLRGIGLSKEGSYYTYSGISIINLEKLERKCGEQSFFKSIADYKKKNVFVTEAKNCSYFDFGTLSNYFNLITGLDENSVLKNFLIEQNHLNKEFSATNKILNFSNSPVKGKGPAIVLNATDNEIKPNHIYFNDLEFKIDHR